MGIIAQIGTGEAKHVEACMHVGEINVEVARGTGEVKLGSAGDSNEDVSDTSLDDSIVPTVPST